MVGSLWRVSKSFPREFHGMIALLTSLALVVGTPETQKPERPAATGWQKAEAAHLKNIKQVTFDFVRAGEGYFSPDGKKIIFQAEEKGTGNPFYQIYVMDLASGRIRRVSPGIGKTTCSYFSPDGKKIIFASSHLDPNAKKKQAEEYKQRAEDVRKGIHRRYRWDFDEYMDIFETPADGSGKLTRLTSARGYDAEGSISADGKHIVFCSNRSGEKNFQLYIMDADGKNVRKLTNAPGCYNGGPFFSPDGKRVIFRADRKKPDHLQLMVINADGTGERALTDDLHWVQWGPYWYRDGKHIIYAGADHSNPMMRPNYDLYWMNTDTGKKVRITHFPGADVLPVFSPDGKRLMWTSTRSDGRSSQLYIADFTPPKD
jgi:TolB protein